MSRIGKKPIIIPSGVEARVDGDTLIVKGPKGELKQKIHPMVTVAVKDGVVGLSVAEPENKNQKALWGLFVSLTKNMITGVTVGYSIQLEINGVGMKAMATGQKMTLNVGFSHPVIFEAPQGITLKTEGNVITVSGIDKQMVGEIAAQIKKVKKVEPYKGKGIKYVGEVVRRKAGKAAGAK